MIQTRLNSSGVSKESDLIEYFRRLGLAVGATSAEIKSAYRQRALECHPDVVPLGQKAAAEAEFRRASEAYAILSNEQSVLSRDAGKASSPTKTRQEAPQNTGVRKAASSTEVGDNHSEQASAASSIWKQPRRGSFVRKDADRFFRDAFDGKTLDDIMFQERVRERRAAKRRQRQADGDKGQPVGHEEVLRHVMSNAARQFADRLAKEYGHGTVKHTRFIRLKGPAKEPPSHVLPFRPFVGSELPAGVSAPPEPNAGPATHISDEHVEHLFTASSPPRETIKHIMPEGTLRSSDRSKSLGRQSSTFMAHNAGQVYSYHRVY